MKIDLGITLPTLTTLLQTIIEDIAKECGTTVWEIKSSSRSPHLVFARVQFAKRVKRELPELTTDEIGNFINRDRSTIRHYLWEYQQPEEL